MHGIISIYILCVTERISEMARILNTEQAAEKLQVKPLTIRKYLRKGLIPGRRIGREWRIVETDLEMFVRTGNMPPESEPRARISARGFLAQFPGNLSSEAFLAEKHAENAEEERRNDERVRARKERGE
jgi:excisionase family DNA binding protein